jgi:hypothetical protein
MRKLAKLIAADDNILRFAIINGLKTYISIQVTQAKPSTIDGILDVARLAEVTLPRAMEMEASSSPISKQLAEITARLDRMSTAAIRSRSSTPERKVNFASTAQSTTHVDDAIDARPDQPWTQRQRRPFQPSSFNRQPRHVTYNQQQQQQRPTFQRQASVIDNMTTCSRCARHHAKTDFCPAMDPSKYCNFCGKQFHFAAACFAAAKQRQQQY